MPPTDHDQSIADLDHDLSALIGYNLTRVVGVVRQDLVKVLAEFDLRIVPFSALSIVTQKPGISQTLLAEALNVERSNLVQIVDDLTKRKLIERGHVASDRRRHALVATPKGQLLLQTAQSAVIAHEARVFATLTQDERSILLALLKKLRFGSGAPTTAP